MAQSGIKPISSSSAGALSASALDARCLATAQRLGRRLDPQDPATARLAAARMVSELFFKPLLAELRASSCGAPFVGGGQTESIFGEQLDQKLADTVASRQSGLIDGLAARLGQRTPAELNQTSWRTRLQATATEASK
jgi:Rod binding domain-containing protein